MKLIEAMKELKVIEKRIEKQGQQVARYAVQQEMTKPQFETEKEQREEVKKLVQGNVDLTMRYIELKEKIERTNLEIKVELGGQKWSISALLQLRRRLGDGILATYGSLDDSGLLKAMRQQSVSPEGMRITRFYDEKEKNAALLKWHGILEAIDGRLEVVNATTDLVE